MSWTPERIAELKKLWTEYSASQIADKLGNVSRNAVIGKANRLGLSKPAAPKSTKQRRPRNMGTIQRNRGGQIHRFSGNAALKVDYDEEYDLEPMDDVVVPISMKLALHELEENTCKWPDGDPSRLETLTFCGHKTKEEKSYCEYHCNRAYLRPVDKRRY